MVDMCDDIFIWFVMKFTKKEIKNHLIYLEKKKGGEILLIT